MVEVISNYENYILNEDNMINYLKYKIKTQSIPIQQKYMDNQNQNQNLIKAANKKLSLFCPRENDSLFWCYYIIKYGDIKYETINHKNILITKQLKIELVNKIRENKQIVKTYKFDTLSNIENNLANDNNINIKTIMSLCAIEKINLMFVSRKFYYELLMNDNEPIYIIRDLPSQNNYTKKYGFEIGNNDLIEEIRNTLYKIDNIDKPIKALSSYKVQDLIQICNKLVIETINKETNKNKTKNELYEAIIQYF